VIESRSGSKVDLIVRKERAFSPEERARRTKVSLPGGMVVDLASPEDTILSKLEWAKKTGTSEKQLDDAAASSRSPATSTAATSKPGRARST
jgi:hypothetical protein